MERKLRLPVAVSDTLTFVFMNGKPAKHLKLAELNVKNNRIDWTFKSPDRHTFYGSTVRDKVSIDTFLNSVEGGAICLSIPVVMHIDDRDALKAEFIFFLPSSVTIQRNHPSAQAFFQD